MSLRFGQTLFGGAAVGLVSAAGIALCTAQAQASFNTIHPSAGTAESHAQVIAEGVRKTLGAPASITVHSHGSASAVAAYSGTGTAVGVANAPYAGIEYQPGLSVLDAQVVYSGYGWVWSTAVMQGQMFRYAKARGRAANLTATAEGDGFVFELGSPGPAVARAWGFGTTHYVGLGTAECTAGISSYASVQRGAEGEGVGYCGVLATTLHTQGGAGIAVATVQVSGEPAVQVGETRYFTSSGSLTCSAEVRNTFVGIHQAQTGKSGAFAEGRGWYRLGAKGEAIATATLSGDALAAATGVTGVVGDSRSSATARAVMFANAKATGVGAATLGATATVTNTKVYGAPALSTAHTSNVIPTLTINTKVYPDTGYGVAQVLGTQYRTSPTQGSPAFVLAQGEASGIRRQVGYGVVLSRALGTADSIRINTKVYGEPAAANSEITATAFKKTLGYTLTHYQEDVTGSAFVIEFETSISQLQPGQQYTVWINGVGISYTSMQWATPITALNALKSRITAHPELQGYGLTVRRSSLRLIISAYGSAPFTLNAFTADPSVKMRIANIDLPQIVYNPLVTPVAAATGANIVFNVTHTFSGVANCEASSSSVYIQYGVHPRVAGPIAALKDFPVRTHFGGGYASALANGIGSNQVNDLVPAPRSRTLAVLVQERTLLVDAQNRTLFV